MADTDTAPTPAPSGAADLLNNPIIQQLLQGGSGISGPAAPATPAVNPNLPITSLLGEAFGGGVSPLYPMSEAQQTQAGNAALLNFGIGMLQNASGPVRHSLGQAIASGLLGAQGSLAGVREGQAQMLDIQNKQQEMRLKTLAEVLPLLRMQQAAGMPNPLAGNAPGSAPGGIAATGAPIAPANMISSISDTLGIPTADAAAIASNFHAESGLIPGINEIKPAPGTRGGFGLAQWTDTQGSPRRTDLEAYAAANKLNVADPATQLAFMKQEIQQKYPNLLAQMAAAKTPEEKAAIFYNTYEGGPPRLLGAHTAMAAPFAALPAPGSAPGAPKTAPTATTATTPPAPVARPPAAPAAPPGTIQGAPDTGGTLVGGPGALPGKITPPGPAVPGDVKTIIGGMVGAGASPTTLAPGTATAGPTAPTIAQAGPTTVTPPAQPVPQQPTQADQPPAPGGKLTIEQYRALHPSVIDPSTYTVTPPASALADAQAAKQTAAQNLQQARLAGDVNAANKAQSDFTIASQNVNKLQQDAAAKSLELRQAAQKAADDRTQQAYDAEMTRQQQAELKAQELAQQAAENEKQRQAQVELEHIKAGTLETAAQKKADIDIAQNDLTERAADAQKAGHIIPVLQQIGSQLGNLPGGVVGTLLAKYDTTGDLTGMLAKMGIVDPSKATAAQLLIAARNFLSIETKPAATGSLRVPEMDKLQAYTPGMLNTPQAQQEMISRLIAYQQRIQDERDFAGNYFGRTDPNTGQRIYDNRGLDKAMNAPVQYDQNGVVTGGGLGPVVPEPPSVNAPDAEHQAYLNYVRRNVKPGMPYQTYAPQTDANGNIVRDANGRAMPQRVTKVKGYD